jgi:uncharacterized cupin superfamily protein
VNRVNVFTAELDEIQTQPGFSWRGVGLGERLGAESSGASIYELDPGQVTFPYHYHLGIEEWLYVIAGEPTLRSPAGERTLAPGELVCFPATPAGAHAVTGPGRILMFGDRSPASMVVYPDSDKLGLRPRASPGDRLNFRRGDAVDYWDGETRKR